MSIYEQRDKPSYNFGQVDANYSKNPHILAWWSADHDKLVSSLIDEWQWDWPWHITDVVTKMTSSATIDNWRKVDPVCHTYAWYNVIMYFALSRAQMLGMAVKIRKPLSKECPLCGRRFLESSLPSALIVRLGIDGLDFCSPCLSSVVLQGTGNPSMSKGDVLEYLRSR